MSVANFYEPKGSTPGSTPNSTSGFTPDPTPNWSRAFTPVQTTYHNPPHLYTDNTVYIITASTINKQKYLNNDVKKQILQRIILKSVKELGYKMFAWAILEEHYHILIEIVNSELLGKLINLINGRSSYEINKLEKTKGRKIWYSYWDTCIRGENDFYRRFNYIHNNPVKHGYIEKLDDLVSYKYSSYPYYLRLKGEEWCNDIFSRFPVIDYAVRDDDY